MASATANSGASLVSVSSYSPTQSDVIGIAVNCPANSWRNRRLYDLYSLISNTMPQDRPGSLTDSQYVNVIAYLLQRNQVPSGPAKLSTDTLGMKKIRIDVGGAAPAAGGQ